MLRIQKDHNDCGKHSAVSSFLVRSSFIVCKMLHSVPLPAVNDVWKENVSLPLMDNSPFIDFEQANITTSLLLKRNVYHLPSHQSNSDCDLFTPV